MELDRNALAKSFAVTTALLWTICFALVVLLPGMTSNMTGHMLHMNLTSTPWVMTGTGFLFGLIVWTVLAGATGWLIAVFYNRFK